MVSIYGWKRSAKESRSVVLGSVGPALVAAVLNGRRDDLKTLLGKIPHDRRFQSLQIAVLNQLFATASSIGEMNWVIEQLSQLSIDEHRWRRLAIPNLLGHTSREELRPVLLPCSNAYLTCHLSKKS